MTLHITLGELVAAREQYMADYWKQIRISFDEELPLATQEDMRRHAEANYARVDHLDKLICQHIGYQETL